MRGRTPIMRQATLNGKHFRSTWPVFHFSVVFPHPARAAPGPPSPWGKATSGGGGGRRFCGYTRRFRPGGCAPHPARATPGPPSPWGKATSRRGTRTEVLRIYAPVPPGRLRPSSVRAVGPATFPVGEGDLRRGSLKIQLCRQISVDVVADGLFLQDSGFSYLGSFRNPSP